MSAQSSATGRLLIVISAPSGAGKTTLCDRLRERHTDIEYSVSCTTRPPRGSEVDGEDYHFLTAEAFERKVQAGEFLEQARVHGYRYGTLQATVRRALAAGRHVLMDIDVQGARQIRERVAALDAADPLRAGFLDIFIAPPSLDVLRERLKRRGEDSDETIARRLANAEREMAEQGRYRRVVVNDDLDTAYRELEGILEGALKNDG